MFLGLGQMFFCIVAFVKRGLASYMDLSNTEGSELKSNLIRFCSHDVWICS